MCLRGGVGAVRGGGNNCFPCLPWGGVGGLSVAPPLTNPLISHFSWLRPGPVHVLFRCPQASIRSCLTSRQSLLRNGEFGGFVQASRTEVAAVGEGVGEEEEDPRRSRGRCALPRRAGAPERARGGGEGGSGEGV